MKSTNDEQRQRVSHPSFVHSNASSSLNSSELTVAMIVPLLTPHPHFFLSVQPLLPRSLLELLREELALLEEVVRGSVVDEDLGGEGDVREEQGSVVGGSFGAGGGKVAGEAVERDEGRGREGQEREGQEGEGGDGDREGDDERFGSPRTGGWVPVFEPAPSRIGGSSQLRVLQDGVQEVGRAGKETTNVIGANAEQLLYAPALDFK